MMHTDRIICAYPKKSLPIFFIIDTSGSMAGSRIAALNSAIEQMLEQLKEMNAERADAEIEIAFLEFSSGARWLTPNGLVKVDDFVFSELEANGLTDMGEAFKMLEEKLHRNSGFMNRPSGFYAPIIILITDGEPTDDYKPYLAKLYENNWFKAAVKISLAIGNEVNDSILAEFTGHKEAIINVPDGEDVDLRDGFMKLVKIIQIFRNPKARAADKTKQELLNDMHKNIDEALV